MPDASGENPNPVVGLRRLPLRRLVRTVLLALGPIVALLVGFYFYATSGRFVGTDDAYLRADRVSISADISGRVVSVDVHENQQVEAGDVLFQIDEEPFRIALARAEAQLLSVRNEIDALRASYRSRQEQMRLDETTVAYAERNFERQQQLVGRGNTPQSNFDDARQAVSVARQQLAMRRNDALQILAGLSGDPDMPVERHPRYLEARAQRDQAALDLRRTVVAAPWAGIVSRIDRFRPGDYVTAGTPVFAVMASQGLWVEANMKETDLTNVRPGQRATLSVDAYPDVTWQATVASISAGTGAEWSVLPAQNATGNWVKVVQRVPVRLAIENRPGQPPLRAGMSVIVEIDTGHRRELPGFLRYTFGWALAWAGVQE
jgi:membrane fusion protein (multidrug efflux system)